MQEFLRALRQSGEVVVSAGAPPRELDDSLASLLEEHERERCLALRPGAPALDFVAAYWGVRKLYEACQLLLLRDAPSEVAFETLTGAYEEAIRPETHYSMDLGLSYLPSLFRLAERLAAADPLLDALKHLGREWPLSSVGMPGLQVSTEPEFLVLPFLRALYLDRILDQDDAERVNGPAIEAGVRAALGAYPEMRPRIHKRLAREGGHS
jgi:hypothetical protein